LNHQAALLAGEDMSESLGR